jgi:hypothetical protein
VVGVDVDLDVDDEVEWCLDNQLTLGTDDYLRISDVISRNALRLQLLAHRAGTLESDLGRGTSDNCVFSSMRMFERQQ